MKDFIFDNWKWLLAILIGFVNLIVCILKRKVKITDSVKEFILKILPIYIQAAESRFTDGELKKSFVLDLVSAELESRFVNLDVNHYIDFINDSIELILSTPQKKGV